MAVTSTASRETPVSSRRANPVHTPASANDRGHASAPDSTHNTGRPIAARPSRTATDDEILGLEVAHPALAPNSSTLSSRQRADVWSDEGSAVGVRDDARADAPPRLLRRKIASKMLAIRRLLNPKPFEPRSTPIPNSVAHGTKCRPTAQHSQRRRRLVPRQRSSRISTAWTRSSFRAAPKTTPSSRAPSPASIPPRLLR